MTTLDQVYDSEEFRRLGHILIDQLADNLSRNIDRSQQKVLDYLDPDDHYQFWQQTGMMDTERYFEEVMRKSIQLHHPKFMGHQVTPPAPLAALAAMQGALLNSGGAVYEMAAASSALEKVVIDRLKPYFGFLMEMASLLQVAPLQILQRSFVHEISKHQKMFGKKDKQKNMLLWSQKKPITVSTEQCASWVGDQMVSSKCQ